MNARDDYPLETIDGKQHDAMCAELDELRAQVAELGDLRVTVNDLHDELFRVNGQVAAVNAALDQYWDGPASSRSPSRCVEAIAKVVGR